MFIEIADDVIDRAEGRDTNAIEVLRKLALAIRYGKHLVYVNHRNLDRIFRIDTLSTFDKSAYGVVKKNFSSLGGLKEWLKCQTIITYARKTGMEKSTLNSITYIYINPSDNPDFEYYEETHLLVENLQDADFYEYVVKYFQRKNKPRNTDYVFYALMGGGSTATKVVEYENKLKQHFLLAIVDSDKKYINQIGVGDTARDVLASCRKTEFNSYCYVMKDVAEIENLIPYNWILNNPISKSAEIVNKNLNFDMSFFDMKKGLRIKVLRDDAVLKYWKGMFFSLLPSSVWDDIGQKCDEDVVLGGFGENIMKHILKSAAIYGCDDVDLTVSQENEWERIGELILTWSCCFSKRTLYS